MQELEIKTIIKDKYGNIASNESACGCCSSDDYSVMKDNYDDIEGYIPNADLGLGCGLPTEYANINEGDTVLDLGSGAGNDAFIAKQIVGDTGKVIGLDMTEQMVEKANAFKEKLKYDNVEFVLGDIEQMPIDSDKIDVVISNCVLNLVSDKRKAFSEIYRVLKPNAHFCISDIVIKGELPEKMKSIAELYAGCVSGALQMDDYLQIISECGFRNISIKKEKEIILPDYYMAQHISPEELSEFKSSATKLLSITVYAKK